MRKGSPLLLCVQGNEMFLPGPIRCPSLPPDVRWELVTVAITGAEVKIN